MSHINQGKREQENVPGGDKSTCKARNGKEQGILRSRAKSWEAGGDREPGRQREQACQLGGAV